MLNNQGHFHAIRALKLLRMWKDELLDIRILDASDFGKTPKSPKEIKRAATRLQMEHGNEKLTLDDARARGERIYEEIRNMGSFNLDKSEMSLVKAYFEKAEEIYSKVSNVRQGIAYFEHFLNYYDKLETSLISNIKNSRSSIEEDQRVGGYSFQLPKDKVITMSSELANLKNFSNEKFYSTNLEYDALGLKIPNPNKEDLASKFVLIPKEDVYFTKNDVIINVSYDKKEEFYDKKIYNVVSTFESENQLVPIKKIGLLNKQEVINEVIEKYEPLVANKGGKLVDMENIYKSALEFFYNQAAHENPLNFYIQIGKDKYTEFTRMTNSKYVPSKILMDPSHDVSIITGRTLYHQTRNKKTKVRRV